MQIERDFTSGKVTLAFESGKRVELTKEETREFDKRVKRIQEYAISSEGLGSGMTFDPSLFLKGIEK